MACFLVGNAYSDISSSARAGRPSDLKRYDCMSGCLAAPILTTRHCAFGPKSPSGRQIYTLRIDALQM